MTFRAKIVGGKIVPIEPIPFKEGEEILIENIRIAPSTVESPSVEEDTVGKRLMKLAGIIDDPSMPVDGSINHDHYLYGTPKK